MASPCACFVEEGGGTTVCMMIRGQLSGQVTRLRGKHLFILNNVGSSSLLKPFFLICLNYIFLLIFSEVHILHFDHVLPLSHSSHPPHFILTMKSVSFLAHPVQLVLYGPINGVIKYVLTSRGHI